VHRGAGQRLARVAAGEQPAADGPGAGLVEEQPGEGLGDRDGRVAEPEADLAVLAAVAGGEAAELGGLALQALLFLLFVLAGPQRQQGRRADHRAAAV
jgi:hypothetical protein